VELPSETVARDVFAAAFGAGIKPDPRITVSEWADQNRRLGTRSSAEPGPWRTSRTPYLKEPMDALSSTSTVQRVVFMKGSQVGGTELGNNWLGYAIDHAPSPFMLVMPTGETGVRKTHQTIDPLLEDTPSLKAKVAAKKSRDAGNTTRMKLFPGGMLVLAAAGSPADLRAMPVRFLFCDEVDAWEEVGDEGDPLELARRGTRTFANRKELDVSTPTVEGRSRIEQEFRLTDRRYYFVPCPFCDAMQKIEWDRLQWEQGDDEERLDVANELLEDRRQVSLECLECKELIPEYKKTEMLAKGVWIPEDPSRGGAVIRGYHLSALYSPYGMYSWRQSVARFLTALVRGESALRVWVNQDLGQTWKERGAAPPWRKLYDRREPYPIGSVPEGGLLLTAGVDVQKDRLEAEVVAWGLGKESWSVSYEVIVGDPGASEVWQELDAFLERKFEHESGIMLPISILAIDSGYATQTVYGWVRRYAPSPRVMAIKGRDNTRILLGTPTLVDVRLGDGRKLSRGVRLWPVDSGVGKEELYAWLGLEAPIEEKDPYPPGFCHFPEYGPEFFKQLTAEVLVGRDVRRTGRKKFEWEKTRERNEALDCRVYARAAASALGIDRFGPQDWEKIKASLGSAMARPRKKRKRKEDSRWHGHNRT